MAAGTNILVSIWHFAYPVDDAVGGAQPTGTLSYDHLAGRFAPVDPTMPLLEQGLETIKLFKFFIDRADVHIVENDQIQVVAPYNHDYANQFFRILAVQRTGFHPSDGRGFLNITARRRETAHGIQS